VSAEAPPRASTARRPRRGASRLLARKDLLVQAASVVAILALWELYAPHVNPILLKPPTKILSAFLTLIQDGTLVQALLNSLRNFAAGFAIALVLGLVLGVITARSWLALNASSPWVNALYSTPSVALVPFLTLWLGIGDRPKVATIALFAVFPILLNTQQGVRQVEAQLLEVARSFCSSERRLWTDLLIPSALPYILVGVKLAIGRALVGMVVAEFLTSFSGGLGALIVQYQNTFRVDLMFVPLVVVAGLGITMIGVVSWLERRLAPWAAKSA
jgi:NitT/TauT family transport system permease protein